MFASVQTQFFQCRPPRPDKVISEIALFVGAHDGGGIERERERENRERERERDTRERERERERERQAQRERDKRGKEGLHAVCQVPRPFEGVSVVEQRHRRRTNLLPLPVARVALRGNCGEGQTARESQRAWESPGLHEPASKWLVQWSANALWSAELRLCLCSRRFPFPKKAVHCCDRFGAMCRSSSDTKA